MTDHDRFCPEYMQYADPCPICIVITSVRADERERFARWKGEATEVMREWEQVWEALGSPGRLGESKAAAVLAALIDGGGEKHYGPNPPHPIFGHDHGQ